MIVRGYMALSEFSFKIEFIEGVDNDIADSMSRLCRNGMLDHPEEFPHTDALAASIIPKIKLTKVIYSKIAFVHNSKVGHFGLERAIKRLHDTNNWILSWDIFSPFSDKTFPTKSISEYPKKHFWALRNTLCFRNLLKIWRSRSTNSSSV
jgi:hypothetical protein